MRGWIRRALTRTVAVRPTREKGKQAEKLQLPPPEALVYGVMLAIVFFVGLCTLQALHLIVTGKFNDQIWAGTMLVLGMILGAFFGGRS